VGEHDASKAQGADGHPVIAVREDWNVYPQARVRGTLTLAHGCLLLDGRVAFWPRGTTWDDSAQAVVFRGGSSVVVGQRLEAAGGVFSFTDLASVLDAGSAIAIGNCMRKTGADSAIFAYVEVDG
jgi:hypothetical protein